MLEVNEIFVSHQGEISVGQLAVFIRFSRCNMQCEYCDTKQSWNEGKMMSRDELKQYADPFDRIIITGGEPLLQKKELMPLVNSLLLKGKTVEIETNGTITPTGVVANHTGKLIFNVSVKLKNNEQPYEKRIVNAAINWHILNDSNFKFVVGTDDDIDDMDLLIEEFKIPKNLIYLMPLGETREKQMENMPKIMEIAKNLGYHFSPRLHILAYDTKKGV